jgi:N-formylglutamate deformylase
MGKPFLITIPHSGETIPPEAPWLKGLPEPLLMCDVDRYVDRLYGTVIKTLNIPHVICPWHRYAVDLNRLADDVDQDSVEGGQNPSGSFTTGLHWVKTTKGQVLMPRPIPRAVHDQIVEKYFEPFHKDVRKIYQDLRHDSTGAGRAKDLDHRDIYHIDAHSMPSLGTKAHRDPGETRAHIVVSDFDGTSTRASFKDLVIEAFRSAGFSVAYNWPYKGGRVTQVYGQPSQGQHVVQVELNRSLYMDEESKQPKEGPLQETKAKIESAIRTIFDQIK